MPDASFDRDPFLKQYVIWASCYDAWTRTLEQGRLRSSAELDLASDLYCDIATTSFEKAAKVVPVTTEGLLVYLSMLIKFEIYGSETQIQQAFDTIRLSLDHLGSVAGHAEPRANEGTELDHSAQWAWEQPLFGTLAGLQNYVAGIDADELFDDRDQTTAVLTCIVRSLHAFVFR